MSKIRARSVYLPLLIVVIAMLMAALLFTKKFAGERAGKYSRQARKEYRKKVLARSGYEDLYYYKHPYLSQAHQLNEDRNYDSAIYYYKQASARFKSEKQWRSYVWVNNYIGRLYLRVSGKDYKEARSYLQTALQAAHEHLSGDDPFAAIALYHWGLYLFRNKNADSSLKAYNKALAILISNYGESNLFGADLHADLGDLYVELFFDPSPAQAHYLKSISIRESLPDTVTLPTLTKSYYDLVRLYYVTGEFEKAQTLCYKAIEFTGYIKNHRADWLEALDGMLAALYQEQHLYDNAIPKIKSVIRINEKNKEGDKGYLSFHYMTLGDLYAKNLNYDSAVFFYKRSLYFTSFTSRYTDQAEQASVVHYLLGMTYLQVKNYPEAFLHLRKCLLIRLKMYGSKHSETAVALQGVGSAFENAGVPDSALKYLGQGITACTRTFNTSDVYAVPTAADFNNSYYSFQIVKDKAIVLKQIYDDNHLNIKALQGSLAHYCLADTLITLYAPGYDREAAKLVFAKNNNNMYEEAIACALELFEKSGDVSYQDIVFNFMDKRRSRLLMEALNQDDVFRQSKISMHEQEAFRKLQQEQTFLQSRLEEEKSSESPNEENLVKLHKRLFDTEAKARVLKDSFTNRSNAAAPEPSADTIQLKDLQTFSGENNVIILEYFWGEKAVYAFGIYKGKSISIKIDGKKVLAENLDSLAVCFRKGYVVESSTSDFNTFQNNASRLYDDLVKPFLNGFNLQEKNNATTPAIIVIPDGPLTYLPFEALIASPGMYKDADYRKPDYLLKRFAISYHASARFLLKKPSRPEKNTTCRVLGLSYSTDAESKHHSGNLHVLRDFANNELPGSAKELRSIALYMHGKFYMGENATEGVFKTEAAHFDILHLAVHGQADSSNSYGSRLIFKKGKDTVNDENLYAYEIYTIPIKAKLAVLSACESGIGRFNTGEGMFSIARGFFYAGCPAVVMSYWKVNDNFTAGMMDNLYRHLSSGMAINLSLRNAKLEFLHKADRRSAHPAYWAAFVATGKMTPVVKQMKSNIPFILMVTVMLAAVASFITIRLIRGNRRRLEKR